MRKLSLCLIWKDSQGGLRETNQVQSSFVLHLHKQGGKKKTPHTDIGKYNIYCVYIYLICLTCIKKLEDKQQDEVI